MRREISRSTMIVVGWMLTGCLFHLCTAEETRDLIMVAGQSNAVGFDADAAKLPPDESDKEVLFWWRCGDPPPDKYDSNSGGKWSTLQAQPKGTPLSGDNNEDGEKRYGIRRQYGNFANAAGGFGPEMGLARALRKAESRPLAVVKVAFSGTGMGTDWNPDDPGDAGACYRALVSETRTAMVAAKAQGVNLHPRALVWVQGESDANPTDAGLYEQRLGAMLAALRQEFHAPGLVLLLSINKRFKTADHFVPKIVAAQKALATKDALCRFVDTEGAHVQNPVHFSAAGTLEIGRRFAEALLAVESGKLMIEPTKNKRASERNENTQDTICNRESSEQNFPQPPSGMVLIPAGTNAGHDPDFGDYSLTVEAFHMDATEISKTLWDEVQSWAVANGYEFDRSVTAKSEKHPVHSVTWYDAVKWCNARSEKSGRTPCYTVDNRIYRSGSFGYNGSAAVHCELEANGFRLPTVAEWEYAARGGLTAKRFPWGDTIDHDKANYRGSGRTLEYDLVSDKRWHPKADDGSYEFSLPVGSFNANGYGLYDMAGNVMEWCQDAVDSYRCIRGGCGSLFAAAARCGEKCHNYPDSSVNFYGFRTVCGVRSRKSNQPEVE